MNNSNFPCPLLNSISLLLALSLLSGCAVAPDATYKEFDLTGKKSVLTDTRTRAITNVPIKDSSRPGLVDPKHIVCAEPSPDVAVALANSFGAGISVMGYGSGSLSGANAESVVQLAERTVTVQLLRDQMYRACEAYANGAITGTTYNLIMSKNNDAMVTLMLGETAGGAFGRSLAAIGTGANSSADATTTLDQLREIQKEVAQAEQNVQTAIQEEQAATEKRDDKKEIAESDATKTGEAAVSEEKKQENEQVVQEADNEVAAAEKNREVMEAQRAAVKTKAAAKVEKLVAASGIAHKPGVGVASVLSNMQQQYLREDFSDEFVSACLIELGLETVGSGERYSSELAAAAAWQLAGISKRAGEGEEITDKDLDRTQKWDKLVKETFRRGRKTALGYYCDRNLIEYIKFADASGKELEKYRINLEMQKNAKQLMASKAEGLNAFQESINTCKSLKLEKNQTTCITTANKIGELGEGFIEVGKVQTIKAITDFPVDPLGAYLRAQIVKTKFDQKVLQVSAMPVSITVSKTELKEKENRLNSTRTTLDTEINSLITIITPKFDNTGGNPIKKSIQDLNENRILLEEKLKSTPSTNKLYATILKGINELEEEVKRKVELYKDLQSQMTGLIQKIDNYIKSVGELQKADVSSP